MGLHQFCFEGKSFTARKELIRMITNKESQVQNNLSIKKGKSDKINISITKTYQKNLKKNCLNIFPKKSIDNSQIKGKPKGKIFEIIKNRRANSTKFSPSQRKNLSRINENNKMKYIKGELKGEDKYGKIYSGLCISNGDIVTIKIYNNLPEDKKRYLIQNKDKIYKLNHPNIIKVLSISNENNNFSVVYESFNLKNVNDLIGKYGILDESIIQMYSKQLLEGMKYLHENKIYHKNIKPNNILVDTDGSIKISDYIIDALFLGEANETYNNLLKADTIEYYVPPFFVKMMKKNEDKFDKWQSYDLWFIGCILIEVASGKKPWSHYNFKKNSEFFNFLKDTNLLPNIPMKLSHECQELIKLLFNPELTNDNQIYDSIFKLNFFNKNRKINISNSINSESQMFMLQNEDSKFISGNQLGKVLEKNKVTNMLSNNNNPSFTVSFSVDESSINNTSIFTKPILSSSMKAAQNVDLKIKNEVNLKQIKTMKNEMPKVLEAQVETSPDASILTNDKKFIFEDLLKENEIKSFKDEKDS